MRLYKRGNVYWVSYPFRGITVRRSTGARTVEEAETISRQMVPEPPRRVAWVHDPATVYVLLARGTDRVKIGHVSESERLLTRIDSLRCGCPFPLDLMTSFEACRREEGLLHKAAESSRIMPRLEWFFLTTEVKALIESAERGTRLCRACQTETRPKSVYDWRTCD